MGRSQRLTLRDIRRAFELIADARDAAAAGASPLDWRRQLGVGLRRVVGSEVAVSCAVPPPAATRRLLLRDAVDLGYPDPMARSVFRDWIGRADYSADPTMAAIETAVLAGRRVTVARAQLQPDTDWYGSFHYNEVRRETRMDDFIRSYRPLVGGAYGTWFSLARAAHSTPFGARDRQVVSLVHRELNRMVARAEQARSEATASSLDGLPPRLRQTADLLARGLSEKQVSAHAGLTRHAVHAHVKRLHQRFDVSSRAELVLRLTETGPLLAPVFLVRSIDVP